MLGIAVDKHNNLDIQNKKIKNLGPPSEETDAVNKAYLQTQIHRSQEILNIEILSIRHDISQLKNTLKSLMSSTPFNVTSVIVEAWCQSLLTNISQLKNNLKNLMSPTPFTTFKKD